MKYFKGVLVFLLAFFLFSCKKEKKEVTFLFEVNLGMPMEDLKVNKKGEINLPIPLRVGYDFISWHLQEDLSDNPLPMIFNVNSLKDKEVKLYAKWHIGTYSIIFNNVEGLNPIQLTYNNIIPDLPTPEVSGKEFIDWYTDSDFVNVFDYLRMPGNNISLYAKFNNINGNGNNGSNNGNNNGNNNNEEQNELYTKVIGVNGYYYGNSNGNLNNGGYAVYHIDEDLHYYRVGSRLYSYNPHTKEDTLIFELESKANISHLNITKDGLMFIESQNGHIIEYSFSDETFSTYNDDENNYVRYDFDFTYKLCEKEVYGNVKNVYSAFSNSNGRLIKEDLFDTDFLDIYSNKIYYKAKDSLNLQIMNYNGQGKTGMIYLERFNVIDVYNVIAYRQDDPQAYYIMYAKVGDNEGLYLIDSIDEKLVNIVYHKTSNINYHNKSFFFNVGSNIYEYSFNDNELVETYEANENITSIQIINTYIYFSTNNTNLFRIDPVTKEIKEL